jgi:hypothetical protein
MNLGGGGAGGRGRLMNRINDKQMQFREAMFPFPTHVSSQRTIRCVV